MTLAADAAADDLFRHMPRVCRLVTIPRGTHAHGFRVSQTNATRHAPSEALAWVPFDMVVVIE